jgi:class 3 adenylate cyclase/tetratricopeptide (TPR) repeat protein
MTASTDNGYGISPEVLKSLTSYLPQELAGHILNRGRVSVPGKRPVAILFADMTGFTSLSESLDPEEVLSTMNHCLAPLVAVIRDHGGLIDKFIGDEIMALFGALRSREDDCERAVRAALDLMSGLEEINRSLPFKLEHPLSLHAGLNYGTVVVGNIGTVDRVNFTVMGDPVNFAARLVERAESGEILVSESVRRRTRGLFDFESLGTIKIRGKSRPVSVFRITGVCPGGGRRGRVAEDELPFVGRLEETEVILAALNRALDCRGQVIEVTGEPGIGKTRLKEEIRRRPEAADFLWLEGRCQSYGENRGYGPFEDLFRSFFDLPSDADPETGLTVIRERLRSLFPGGGWKDISFAVGRLLFGRGGGAKGAADPAVDWKSLFQFIDRFFLSLSREKPLVIAVEDCQWIDRTSAELLAYIIEHSLRSPIVFYLNRRPEVSARFAPLVKLLKSDRDEEFLWRIGLQGLPRADGKRLSGHLAGLFDLPADGGDAFLARSEGNPLFLEELVRSYHNREITPVLHGGRGAAMDLDRVPATLAGLLTGRIDRLRPPLRIVLETASVIGRHFDIDILSALLPDQAQPTAQLVELSGHGLISAAVPTGSGRFKFRHHLMRDVVYQHMLKESRTAHHNRLARSMVEELKDRLPDLCHTVAYHFEKGAEPRQAMYYYLKAAGRSRERDAPKEAIRFLDRALVLGVGLSGSLPSGMERSARMIRASLHKLTRDYERALGDYRWVIEEGNGSTGTAAYCRALNEIGEIHRLQGRPDQALTCFSRAVARAQKAGRPKTYAEGLNRMGVAAAGTGDLEGAEKYFMESLTVRRRIEDAKGIADCLTNLGGVALHRGKLDLAIEYNQKAQRKYERLGEKSYLARSLNNIGAAMEKKGDLEVAGDYYSRSLVVSTKIGDRLGVAMSLSNLGNIELALKNFEAAVRKHGAAIHIFRSLDHKAGEAHSLNGLGLAYSQMMEYDRAEEMFEGAYGLAAADLDLSLRLEISLNRIMNALNRGDRKFAGELAKEALEQALAAKDMDHKRRFREVLEQIGHPAE